MRATADARGHEVFFPNIHRGMTLLPWVVWGLRGSPAGRGGLWAGALLVVLAGAARAMLRPTAFARFLERADPEGRYRTLGESFYRSVSPMQVPQESRPGRDWRILGPVPSGAVRPRNRFDFDFDVEDLARTASLRWISSVLADFDAFFGSFAACRKRDLAMGARPCSCS